MVETESRKPRFFLPTQRIEALTDGIFGFSMTLLALNLTLPDTLQGSSIPLSSLIFGQVHKFENYFFSFFILAIFWIVLHHQFHWIRGENIWLLLINILMLMFVALMPFSADVAGDFPDEVIAQFLFTINVMILSLLLLANWVYATHNRRLVDEDLGQKTITLEFRRSLMIPLLSGVAVVTSLLFPPWHIWFYLLLGLVLFYRTRQRD